MPQTRTCDYCGDDIEPGTGTMFVHVDGTTVHYCSAKCEKNADLGREPRDVAWTEEGQAGGDVEPEAEEVEEVEEPEAEDVEEVEEPEAEDVETGEQPDDEPDEPDETETTTTDDDEPGEPEEDEE